MESLEPLQQDMEMPVLPPPVPRLWQNKSFVAFWLGQSISALGDACALIAFPLLVLQTTGSVVQMGVVTGIAGIAMGVASLLVGVIVDRVDRRRFMMFCDVGRTCLYGAVPLSWWLFGPHIWTLYVVIGLGSALGLCFQVAAMSALNQMVGEEQLTAANSYLQASYSIAYIIGPALTGFISASLGPVNAISIDALSFIVSVLSLLLVRLRPFAISYGVRQNVLADLREGVQFLWRVPILRTLFLLQVCFSLLSAGGGGYDLYIYHLKHDLGQSDSAVGLIFGLASLGGILAGFVTPGLSRRFGLGRTWLGSIICVGLTLVLIGIVSNVPALVLITIIFSLANTASTITVVSLRQLLVPDAFQGRANAAFALVKYATGPLASLATATLAALIGSAPVLLGVGIIRVCTGGLSFLTPAKNAEEMNKLNGPAEGQSLVVVVCSHVDG